MAADEPERQRLMKTWRSRRSNLPEQPDFHGRASVARLGAMPDVSTDKPRSIIFFFMGVAALVSALWGCLTTLRFVRHAASTKGEVVGMNPRGSRPEIRFVTRRGETIEYSQAGLIFGYQKGDSVTVLYDPETPRDASIDAFGALWGFYVLIVVLGVVFLSAAAGHAKEARKQLP